MSVFEVLPVLTIENFPKCHHDYINLTIIKSICRKLVLVLKIYTAFQKYIWQRKQIYKNGENDHNWSHKDCQEQLKNVFTLVILSLVCSQNEKGICIKTGKTLIKIDSKYYRPSEVDSLLGDPTKAKTILGWNPEETSFEKLVELMVKSDLKIAKSELTIRKSYDQYKKKFKIFYRW